MFKILSENMKMNLLLEKILNKEMEIFLEKGKFHGWKVKLKLKFY